MANGGPSEWRMANAELRIANEGGRRMAVVAHLIKLVHEL
jgi:hypothetical protein